MSLLKKYMDNNIKYISVTALNRYISYKFEMDTNLKEVYLKGEISNFKYSGRHCYFSLKDQTSEISAMFFYPDNVTLNFEPRDGMSVQVIGQVQVYQKRGTYAIIVKKMQQEGIGILYQQYLELKDQLQKEGLFDERRKLPIPDYPEKIAVITASTGEAIHDIISTFNRRMGLGEIRLYPALVQGADAPRDLVRALYEVYRDNWADVIIIGRGGGSFEDLSCFNDEKLARLLASSKIPTISAVGHEGDYTICDFVASYRAPTPTGAAMRLTKDKTEVLNTIYDKMARLISGIKHKLVTSYNEYERLLNAYPIKKFDELVDKIATKYYILDEKINLFNPKRVITNLQDTISSLDRALLLGINHNLMVKENNFDYYFQKVTPNLLLNNTNQFEKKLDELIDKCNLLNPFNVMKKGYSIILQNDRILKSVDEVDTCTPLIVKMHDGNIKTNIVLINNEKGTDENGK